MTLRSLAFFSFAPRYLDPCLVVLIRLPAPACSGRDQNYKVYQIRQKKMGTCRRHSCMAVASSCRNFKISFRRLGWSGASRLRAEFQPSTEQLVWGDSATMEPATLHILAGNLGWTQSFQPASQKPVYQVRTQLFALSLMASGWPSRMLLMHTLATKWMWSGWMNGLCRTTW